MDTNLKTSDHYIWREEGGCGVYIDDFGNKFIPLEFYKRVMDYERKKSIKELKIEKLVNIFKEHSEDVVIKTSKESIDEIFKEINEQTKGYACGVFQLEKITKYKAASRGGVTFYFKEL
jgi:predicted Zn-dependent protease with MMP-like domain